MRVIICGSRDLEDYAWVCRAIEESGIKHLITVVVSGRQRGADQLGERWANENDIPVDQHEARWHDLDVPGAVIQMRNGRKYNAAAGPQRNAAMAKVADAVIACPGPESKGTWGMINKALDKDLPVFVLGHSGQSEWFKEEKLSDWRNV